MVSINNTVLEEDMNICPNPASKTITITSKNEKQINEVSIYNLTGQKVLQEIPENNTLDISNLKGGIYIIELVIKNGNVRKKLVVL